MGGLLQAHWSKIVNTTDDISKQASEAQRRSLTIEEIQRVESLILTVLQEVQTIIETAMEKNSEDFYHHDEMNIPNLHKMLIPPPSLLTISSVEPDTPHTDPNLLASFTPPIINDPQQQPLPMYVLSLLTLCSIAIIYHIISYYYQH
eukprot:TRINITY_DN2293_c0_g1_i4.p1 TRINITY_DN2293_c0_g1~~TRINITY_DN2293_c0_g1_i4.p1  ORF type:complete len:147 (-),score=16.26 TRINITY_DN2293_c0_g1_i4:29-469(-)